MVCPVTLEGEELWLLADKALYWPARQCLLINDIRVILCQHPTETTLFNGDIRSVFI